MLVKVYTPENERLEPKNGAVGSWKSMVNRHFSMNDTLWKINMEPKNRGLEDDVPFQFCDF